VSIFLQEICLEGEGAAGLDLVRLEATRGEKVKTATQKRQCEAGGRLSRNKDTVERKKESGKGREGKRGTEGRKL
jgi:hypothetical protein